MHNAPIDHPPVSKRASYAIAVMATAVVALARGALDPWLGDQAILLPFVLAVLAGVVTGGLGPGLVATALATLVAVTAFFEPRGSLAVLGRSDVVHLVVFGGVSIVSCLIVRWFGTSTHIGERRRLAEAHEGRLAAERAARAQVEAAMRQRDEFVATLAHELRTPLNAVLGWTQMLRRSTNPDRLARGLEVIERNTRAEAQIISDLLDIGCITSGRIRMVRAPVPLVGALRTALCVVRPAADARRVRVDAAADPDAVVMGDATRLQQIVWNLLSNAVKFTPAGGRIELTARCMADSVELSVSDSGQGIDPAFLPFVFDRYRQADGSPTRSQGGLGLGLSLTKYLVELHGGTIEAHSEGTGRGATFIVRLPAAGRDDVGAAACDRVRLAGARVLVVEDQPDGLAIVSRILRDHGGRVVMASSADQALERFDRCSPDLIVSDIDMLGMSGFELLSELRAREHGRRAPAIALTSFARAEDRTRSLMAGYQGHVPKPVDPAELLATAASLLHLADRADAVPAADPPESRHPPPSGGSGARARLP